MTRAEEKILLRSMPHHYLWDKPRVKWTALDIENLKKGVDKKRNISSSRLRVKRSFVQPVFVVIKGVKEKKDSVVEASKFTGIKATAIYQILNGKMKQKENIKFYKIV